ncbi:PC-Esterase [Dillenia turbinata]|uniref:PC-Esterase n=1 Tax=Dillenia turbinata TaxID=194707 RepID=A0AAN8ZDK4_9MAGN
MLETPKLPSSAGPKWCRNSNQIIRYNPSSRLVLDFLKHSQSQFPRQFSSLAWEGHKPPSVNISSSEGMENLFEGKCVFDNESYPTIQRRELSVSGSKSRLPEKWQTRLIVPHQHWRWQPNACKIPRFDAVKLLHILKGKRLMFVGAFIQRAQYDSLVRLAQSVIREGRKPLQRIPPRKIFKERIMICPSSITGHLSLSSPFQIMQQNTVLKRMVRLDSVPKHGRQWKEADILVFEIYVWWMYDPQNNAMYGAPDRIKQDNVTTAYRLALHTCANWLESNTNPLTQKHSTVGTGKGDLGVMETASTSHVRLKADTGEQARA